MKANKFVVSNFNNSNDISGIEKSIHSHGGINAVRVDMQANTITVDYDEGRYSEGDIKDIIIGTGLNVVKVK